MSKKNLNFQFIGMVGHEVKKSYVITEGRQEVKDSASSSDLRGDCIGMLSKKD